MRSIAYALPYCLLLTSSAFAQVPAWVTIKGQVVLPAGLAIPARKPVPGANAAPCPQGCPKKGPILDEAVIIDPETRGIQNVVVWLRPANVKVAAFAANEIHPADAKRKPEQHVIDQPCCMFTPRILAARVGDTILVKNPAPFVHNFFWASVNNGNFNQNMAANAQFRLPKPLVAETAPIQYKCTVHPWMSGLVRIFDHPYYAVTDEKGNFEIKNAPAGNYRIQYWHENVGYLGGKDGRFGTPLPIQAGAKGVMELDATGFDVR
jgi:hypothetical protein